MQLGQSAVIGLVAFWQVMDFSMAQYLLHTFKGTVGAGNSTFYKLTREGAVRLVLESQPGSDADLYVSDKTLHPDYTNYDLQSVTCGYDEVLIPRHFQRPVGIAVFGHPAVIEISSYMLMVTIEDPAAGQPGASGPGPGSGGPGPAQAGPGHHHHSHTHTAGLPSAKDEEESVIWTIFVGILKIIFDILM